MTPLSVLGLVVPLADKPPDPSQVGQGWAGFLVFLFLAVATVLLWLSFRRQLKKVNFEEKPGPEAGPEPGPAGRSGTTKP
jgi:hypothetical protein